MLCGYVYLSEIICKGTARFPSAKILAKINIPCHTRRIESVVAIETLSMIVLNGLPCI